MMELDFESTLDQILGGDTTAYLEIVRAYHPEVMRVVAATWHCLAQTPTGVQGFEDLVQQVFVDVYLNLDAFRRGTNFGAWVRTIARNRVKQAIRAWNRENRRLEVYRQHLQDRLADDAAADEHEAAYFAALSRCMQRLPHSAMEILQLRYSQSLSFQQIAERVKSTAEAVRKVVTRSQVQLRDCIESQVR